MPGRYIAIAALAMSLALAACAAPRPEDVPADPPAAPAYLQAYASCWADAARNREAQPPANTFSSYDAALLRCRHLAPGPDHYLRRDEEGRAVHVQAGRPQAPRYDYSTEAHAACLTDTSAWFRGLYPHAGSYHPNLFAEVVCAVPPPQYTNVRD